MGQYTDGTQEQLDAAMNNAMLIPERTLFIFIAVDRTTYDDDLVAGDVVLRGVPLDLEAADGKDSVAVRTIDGERWCYVSADELAPYTKKEIE